MLNNPAVQSDINMAGHKLTNLDGTNLGFQPHAAALDTLSNSSAFFLSLSPAANAAAFKTLLLLENVNNTSDLAKPISTATQTALDLKVDENGAIVSATKTKITYDAKGLVTAGADATTADVPDSTDKRYVTDAQRIVIQNTSNVNSGDQDLSGLVPITRSVNGHPLSSNVTVTAADAGAVAINAPITGATKTKITYDAKGLVTSGADATTADIADSTDKRYVTDAQRTIIQNTSGTNTGDQIVPSTSTATSSNFLTGYNAGTGAFTKTQPAFSDIASSIAAGQVPNDLITYAKMQNVSAQGRFLGRKEFGGAGDVEEFTIHDALNMLSASEGDIIYRSTFTWEVLHAGNDGDILMTHGTTLPPTYETPSGGSGFISNTPFASSWNGVTTNAPNQNTVYDWGHTFDTDDDGKVNVLDVGAGLTKTDAGGVVSVASAGTDYYNPGGTDVAIVDGGTGASTAAAARTNLGLTATTGPVLLSTTNIDLNSDTTPQVLYTVPAGRKFIYTNLILRNFSANIALVRVKLSSSVGDFRPDAIRVGDLSPTTADIFDFSRVDPSDAGHILAKVPLLSAGDTLTAIIEVPEGSSATCKIDVFGYLLDSSTDVPVPNVYGP